MSIIVPQIEIIVFCIVFKFVLLHFQTDQAAVPV